MNLALYCEHYEHIDMNKTNQTNDRDLSENTMIENYRQQLMNQPINWARTIGEWLLILPVILLILHVIIRVIHIAAFG